MSRELNPVLEVISSLGDVLFDGTELSESFDDVTCGAVGFRVDGNGRGGGEGEGSEQRFTRYERKEEKRGKVTRRG